ncbi:hypothetical protein HZH68_014977 [Vespula germanica]|uniref:Uncharacterized protein n=1 Tax=Vespula germanica TaxID=30212 RepID=A0A834J728_VESGE|nr:hypothetical protein HZH68_014977 [Vespula germanica]
MTKHLYFEKLGTTRVFHVNSRNVQIEESGEHLAWDFNDSMETNYPMNPQRSPERKSYADQPKEYQIVCISVVSFTKREPGAEP